MSDGPRERIVWLASYPKSGNTWLRVLLANYVGNGDEPADINRLEGGPIASARTWFDDWVGVEASSLDADTIDSLRPDVYRCLAADAKDTLFMKVHDAWSITPAGTPMFPPDVTASVVYAVRNPLDMAASVANHYQITIEQAVDQLCDPTFSTSSRSDRLHYQLRQRLGSWADHVRSWLDLSGLPVILVRYEDLRSQTTLTFRHVVERAGLEVDDERISRAVAFSEFSSLQLQEAEHGFRERPNRSPFFRRGAVGAWKDELTPDLAARLVEALGPTMRRLGYSLEEVV